VSSVLRSEFADAMFKLSQLFDARKWLDCEALERRHGIGKGTLIVLDLIYELHTYGQQRFFTSFIPVLDWLNPASLQPDSVCCLPSFTYDEALNFWELAPVINLALGCTFYEGLVAKRLDSAYNFQLRSDSEETGDWIKHRFTTA
jgi:hypothetical protein